MNITHEGVKRLWDMNIQCDNVIEARRPDIVITDKKEKSCIIVDIAVPADGRVHERKGKRWRNNRICGGKLEGCGK